MRHISPEIKQLLESSYAETTDVVKLTIPPTIENPEGAVLYLASRADLVINGVTYLNYLRKLGNIKLSLGQAPDNASFSIENVSLTFSSLVSDKDNYIEGATALISRAFKLPNGEYELVPLFDGKLSGLRFTEEDIAINLTSHMSVRTAQMAKRPLTQRCIWKFKGSECGWVPGMGGDDGFETTSLKFKECDRGWDTANGCLAHGNIHRYGGIPQFTVFQGTPSNSGTTSGGYDTNRGGTWGAGSGGGWCIAPESYVLVHFERPIWKMAMHLEKDDIVYAVDRFSKLAKVGLSAVNRGETTSLYTISTESGYSITCSPSHPIIMYAGDDRGTPASAIRPGMEVLCYSHNEEQALKDKVKDIEIVSIESEVILLSIDDDTHTFIAGNTKLGGIVSHNRKEIPTKMAVAPERGLI